MVGIYCSELCRGAGLLWSGACALLLSGGQCQSSLASLLHPLQSGFWGSGGGLAAVRSLGPAAPWIILSRCVGGPLLSLAYSVKDGWSLAWGTGDLDSIFARIPVLTLSESLCLCLALGEQRDPYPEVLTQAQLPFDH